MQLPLFDVASDWTPPDIAQLPSWRGAARVGVDVETYDPHLKETGPSVRSGGHLIGVSFALEDGPAYYLPMRHEGGGNLTVGSVLSYLRTEASNYTGTVVGHNLNYDLDYLAEAGVTFPSIKWQRDTMLADPLLDELQDSYSLDAVARRWGYPGKNTDLLERARANAGVPKGQFHQLHSKYVGPYAEHDARLPLLISRRQERELEQQDLLQIYDLESQLQPVLLAMTRRGIRVDLDALQQVEDWALQEEKLALQAVRTATAIDVPVDGVWKKDLVVKALLADGVTLGRTPSGQPKVDKALLNASGGSKAAAAILRARKVNKLRTTFVASVRAHLVGDRIHATFNQLRGEREYGALVGARARLSMANPNLQQQPIRDEFGPMWRAIYVADEGCTWASADYSQQEPRMLTHFAELCGLRGAKEMADRYRNDPTADNHNMMTIFIYGQEAWDSWDKPTKKRHRDPCKNIFLGLCYGMGSAKLARSVNLPTKWITNYEGRQIEVAGDEAQKLLDKFNDAVPFVKELSQLCMRKAEQRGYIITVLGRRCRFPLRHDGTRDWTHKALNFLIQPSSADQTKKALIEVHKAGIPVQLQVHDELNASVRERTQGEEMADIMRNCVKLQVPSRVDLTFGANWGATKTAT